MIQYLIMSMRISQERQKYEIYLNNEGLRFSRGREAVFHQAINTHGHFTAEEIAKSCMQLNPMVSRATVYRTLH